MRMSLILGVGACAALASIAGAATVTLPDLLEGMNDLGGLARLPSPAYTGKQFSSYDRASTDPGVATDENWFANGDRGHHIRHEERNGETEWVMMDAEGPGAIVRIWSANPDDAGVLRIYLDGSAEPVIAMPLTELLRGETFPFISPIAGERARGWNSHLPISYATHCKVTASKPNFYYHVNYRTYEPGTEVETYTPELAGAYRNQIEEAAAQLRDPAPVDLEGASEAKGSFDIAPGESPSFGVGNGGAIQRLEAQVAAEDLQEALRACWLEIFFDDEAEASVAAPLGDFFGTAPGLNPYASLTCGALPSGLMYSNWVMPYRDRARIVVTNHSERDVHVDMTAYYREREWTDDSLYFNAAWRAEFGIPTRPRQDWNYITIDGAGRFVGDSLQISNPTPAWWGEGDEKIYVDHEEFPSTFGTGTEDYYGYAWCAADLFTHAYHNQPRCDGPGNYGYTNVNRFHVLDDIPFTEALRFDMEVWHWADVKVDMAATSYWYATPSSSDNRPALDTSLLRVDEVEPIPSIEGAIEGEFMEVVSVSSGTAEVQSGVAWNWSRAEQVWWTGASEGATLTLAFPVEKAGRYAVNAVLTKARDYGIVTIAVNDGAASEPIDLYNRQVEVTPEIDLGTYDLEAGNNTLTVTVAGTNPRAEPDFMFGLDYLTLSPK